LTSDEIANTAAVIANWDDDLSRAHHLQFLAWRRLRQEWSFAPAPVTTGDRFFIPEVTALMHAHECLLDAGGHHGSVIEAFLARTKGRFRRIVAFEPDPANRAALERCLAKRLPDHPDVTVHDFALADEQGEASFHDGLGYASQLSSTGRLRVCTRPLDALEIAPSFVKLHVEGGELAALQGARETLLAHRPIVATTIYHNADGIWRTPLWLMETLPDYRFLLRNHSWCGTGSVVYAIPAERHASKERGP
jgi:FkbM family methyltransferase